PGFRLQGVGCRPTAEVGLTSAPARTTDPWRRHRARWAASWVAESRRARSGNNLLASSSISSSRKGAMTWLALFPERIPHARAAGSRRLRPRPPQGATLQPAHPAPFPSWPDYFAAGLRRAAAYAPPSAPVAGVARPGPILPQVSAQQPP